MLTALAIVPAVAQAGVGSGAVPSFPAGATVGESGLPATVDLINNNSAQNASDTNTVCNTGDPAPCPVGDPGITLIPSCGQLGAFSTCTPAGADPGVFRISDTATGAAGTACAGMVFDVALIDPVTGQVRFTPRGGAHVTLPGAGLFCRIAFTFAVQAAPRVDHGAAPGVQTVQIVDNTQYGGSLTASARGTSTGTTVMRAQPAITTRASGDILLGGQLTDTAVVSGLVNPLPGATVGFALYGPDDATCAGTPVFTSSDHALGADGTATSDAFTPTAAGTYRWRAFYSGDANNAPVSGACNEANENATVTVPPGNPPENPTPTTPVADTPESGVLPESESSPKVRVLGVAFARRRCTGSNFTMRVRTQVAGLKNVRVTLDGKTIARSKKARFTVRVRAAAKPFGRHVIRVIATGTDRRVTTRTVSFKRCGRPTQPRFVG